MKSEFLPPVSEGPCGEINVNAVPEAEAFGILSKPDGCGRIEISNYLRDL